MKIRELLEKLKEYSIRDTTIKTTKWKDIESKIHDTKITTCCDAPLVMLDNDDGDIGICFKCRKFGFNKANSRRLSNNRNQHFKKIAADNIYNNQFNKKQLNVKIGGQPARNEKKRKS